MKSKIVGIAASVVLLVSLFAIAFEVIMLLRNGEERVEITVDNMIGEIEETINYVVTFEEPSIEKAVRAYLGIPEGEIWRDQLDGIRGFYIYNDTIAFDYSEVLGDTGEKIQNLNDLKHFLNIRSIHLSKGELLNSRSLTSLNTFSYIEEITFEKFDSEAFEGLELTQVDSVTVKNCSIDNVDFLNGKIIKDINIIGTNSIDLSALSTIKTLEKLNFSSLQNVDLSFLEGISSTVTSLQLNSCNVQNIQFVSKLINLSSFSISSVDISDIKFLNNLAILSEVAFSNCPINDFSPLENSKNSIKILDLTYCNLKNLDTIPVMPQLLEFNLTRNQISDLSHLEGFKSLESITLDHNKLKDFTTLPQLQSLKELVSFYTPFTSIDGIQNAENLNKLAISNSQIEDITLVSKLKKLTFVNLSGNQITDISPILDMPGLEMALFLNNPIKDISNVMNNISKLENIININIDRTNISAEDSDKLRELIKQNSVKENVE